MKTRLLFAVFAFIVIASCKKYPDGPLINLESKKKRICQNWDIEYFSINGFDSTAYLRTQPYYGKYCIYDGKDMGLQFTYENSFNSSLNYNSGGDCKFVNNSKSIYFHFRIYTQPNACGPYRANDVTWEIRRLTSSDLWLKTNYVGKEYFVKFKH